MIVYEELPGERGYALYDSPDLKSWRRMSFLPGFYECPELFEMPVEGSPGESYWVVYGCRWEKERSVFQVGNFDGDTFTPLTEPIQAHYGPHFYAAQTFSNQPDRRRLMIGWLAGASYPDMPFSQGMTIPLELSLKRFSTGLRLCFYPAAELEALRVSTHSAEALTFEQVQSLLDTLQGELFDLILKIPTQNQGSFSLEVGNQVLAYNPVSSEVSFARSQVKLPEGTTSIEIRLLVDRSVTEVFVNQGWAAFSTMTLFPPGPRRFKLSGEGHVQLVIIHLLRSIWE
jgi:fructan beta-fructosidase